jgi:hypothetical protein
MLQHETTTLVRHDSIKSHIMRAVRDASNIELDVLVMNLPTFSWSQVFLEVDRLSRTGEVQVISKGGVYWLSLGIRPKISESTR